MSVVENVAGPVKSLIASLFPSGMPFANFSRIGLAQEPIADRYGGYLGKNEDETKYESSPRGYPTMEGAAEALRGERKSGREAFRAYVRSTGLPVNMVSHNYLTRRFGGDFIGYRTADDEILYAKDRNGVPLTKAQQDAVIAHELGSERGHRNSDPQAQRNAIALLRSFDYKEAEKEAIRMQRVAGWN